MTKYRYDLSEATLPYECRNHYVTIKMFDNEGNLLHSITTNKALEGRFVWSKYEQVYCQTVGTCDFYLPKSPSGMRALLKREYEEYEKEAEWEKSLAR